MYLWDNDPAQTFEFAGGQMGIWFNSLIYSGGTLTVTYSNTNSTLNTSQQFSSVPNILTKLNDQTLLKLAGESTDRPVRIFQADVCFSYSPVILLKRRFPVR